MENQEVQYIENPFVQGEALPMILVSSLGRNYIGGFAGVCADDVLNNMSNTLTLVYPVLYMEVPNKNGSVEQVVRPVYNFNLLIESFFVKADSFYLLKSDEPSDVHLVQQYEGAVSQMMAHKRGLSIATPDEVAKFTK